MIALTQTFIILFMSAFTFRRMVFVFLIFLSLAPRSLGMTMADGSFSMTFLRMAFPAIFLLYFASILSRKTPVPNDIKALFTDKVFLLLLMLGLYKILSSSVNGTTVLYAIENFAFSVCAFGLFYLAVTYKIFQTSNFAFLGSCALIFVIVIFELILQLPLHYNIADTALFNEDVLNGQQFGLGDRGYRVQAIFDNSLSLSEYLVYMLPIVLYMLVISQGLQRLILFAVGAAIIFVGYKTDSRGFIICGSLSTVFFALFYYWTRLSGSLKFIAVCFAIPSFMFLLYWISISVGQFADSAANVSFYNLQDSAERSTYSRARQLTEVTNVVRTRPWFGYGVLQNYSNELEEVRRIDNYYLRTMLESGFVGLSIFLLFLGTTFIKIMSWKIDLNSKNNRAFFAFSLSILIAFTGSKMFLSMPTNNFIFFTILGMIMGLSKRLNW